MAEATVSIKVSWREAGLIIKALQIAAGFKNLEADVDNKFAFDRLANQLTNKKEK